MDGSLIQNTTEDGTSEKEKRNPSIEARGYSLFQRKPAEVAFLS